MREVPPALRLGLFGAALAAVLVGSLSLGRSTGEVAQAAPVQEEEHAASTDHGATSAPAVTGTSLSDGDLRLDVPVTTLPSLDARIFTFRVLDGSQPLTEFDVEQGKQMHLVIVSRDLSRHAHVHPELAPDGTWSTRLTLAAGSYRAVADFSTGGERHSLGIDLAAAGPLTSTPLPPPATTSTTDGLRVELVREGDTLAFTSYDTAGRQVVPEPYLGARGHLVAFRAGDLAYAHVHPSGEDGATTLYEAELPGPGTYRLFLEQQVDGEVVMTPFTMEVSA